MNTVNKKLESLLKYASQNIPYYIKYFNNNKELDPLKISDYPIIEKKDIVDKIDLFLHENSTQQELSTFKTSGSTGIPLIIYKSKNDKMAQLKSIWKVRMSQYGITSKTKGLTFHFYRLNTSEIISYDDIVIKDNMISINATNLNIDYIVRNHNIIEEFKPEYIIGTPSVVCTLLQIYEKINVKFLKNLRYIELMGEYVYDYQRRYISNRVDVKINNFYGCTEIYGIAQENKACNNLHIMADNAYVEIYKNGIITSENNIEGEVVITGLNSYVMPFIRYRLGDIGKLTYNTCSCKTPKLCIELLAGRSNDYISLINDEKKHSSIFSSIIDKINDKYNTIRKYKIIQSSLLVFDVYLNISNESYKDNIKSLFLDSVDKINMKNYYWKIKFVEFDKLPNIKNKFSYFENLLVNKD